ncbi:MAG: GNAT family N-acetyltransferase [Ruminococcus sp.]|nr:GNAT family N-acetyltransferase [Ruminococcus sp.]
MEFEYKKATIDDLNILTKTRIEVLRAANGLDDSIDMTRVERETRAYYENALANGSHTAYLVFDEDVFIGAGGISYYTVMPTFHNPTGKKAYIMNMYTRSDYRRKGVATRTLDLLIQDAKKRGVTVISLESTDMGRKLYERYGFVSMTSEMELPIK